MQDIHSIGEGGRLFGAGGGDRRLRPHPHHQSHQALKCPRCDSLNTKFCYYNNYNLSQPRHFCKNCRRYWTKGGVLRNVPVGGGCRKAKRNSKPKPSSDSPAQTQAPAGQRDSHSSSQSSSTLTATHNNNCNNTNFEALSVHSLSSVSNGLSKNSNDPGGGGGNFEPAAAEATTTTTTTTTAALLEQGSSDCGIFPELGTFTSLITASNDALPFGFSNLFDNNAQQVQNESQWRQQQEEEQMMVSHHQDLKMQEMSSTTGLLHQTVQVELSASQDRSGNTSNNNGGFGSLHWQGSTTTATGDHHHHHHHQGLFDLPNAVDYWSQSNQWTVDQDHPSLYLP